MADREEISFEEELRRALGQQPFHPFTIKLTSGDRYKVTDPWQVAIGTTTVVFMHPKRGASFLRKNQIVAVDVPERARH